MQADPCTSVLLCTLSIFSSRSKTKEGGAVHQTKTVALLTDFLHVSRLYDDCFVIRDKCGFSRSKQCIRHILTISMRVCSYCRCLLYISHEEP